jgi:hypothetical protein
LEVSEEVGIFPCGMWPTRHKFFRNSIRFQFAVYARNDRRTTTYCD